MRITYLNSKADIAWLHEVHLKTPVGKSKAAELFGNEDSPHAVVLYSRKDPLMTDHPLAVYSQDLEGNLRKEEVHGPQALIRAQQLSVQRYYESPWTQ